MPTNLINQTYFIGEIAIPNLSHQADLEKLNYFIQKYEPECLLRILGYPLSKAFSNENSERMTDLLNGAEYYDGEGFLRKWQGLIHDSKSLIASYIFFYHQQNYATHNTGIGTTVQKPEAGNETSPASKMANAWNYFSQEVFDMTHFLWMKRDIDDLRSYPEFTYHQFLETRRISRKIDSVYSF